MANIVPASECTGALIVGTRPYPCCLKPKWLRKDVDGLTDDEDLDGLIMIIIMIMTMTMIMIMIMKASLCGHRRPHRGRDPHHGHVNGNFNEPLKI